MHFPKLDANQPTDYSIYINFIQDLRQQFEIRFTDIHSKKADFKLFSQPLDVESEIANKDFQMQLIELQSTEFYKSKFGASLIKFYKKYLNESKSLSNLIDHKKIFICMFGSTCMCEKLFSKIKCIKSKNRSKLTDLHLDSLLGLTHAQILKPI